MQRKRNNRGFTLAETLIVVLIIIILAALIFISVIAYQRTMAKLEYDGYAKEIFIAAQNHLTMAEGQGYLGRSEFGEPEKDKDGKETGIYYFVVNVNSVTGAASFADGSVLELMLPIASVDDTVRLGGQYIVRYHPDSAQVLDVFYWSDHATPARFSLEYNDDYAVFLTMRGNEKKNSLRDYNGAVVGYYGGEEAAGLTHGPALKAPSILIRNGETLTVEVTNPNTENENAELILLIEGLSSGITREIDLGEAAINVENNPDNGRIIVMLDDITIEKDSVNSLHFCALFSSDEPDKNLIPGENLKIRAIARDNTMLTNVAYSAAKTTNSLFADGTDTETAKIAFFRHLENLDNNQSNLSYNGSTVMITKAEQIAHLSWSDSTFIGAADPNYAYKPVSPGYFLDYDGKHMSISNLEVNAASGSAGVFGELSGELDHNGVPAKGSVCDLELIDLQVSGVDAGALAGKTTDIAVSNVLARNNSKDAAVTVTGSGSVGGLIGSVTGGTVEQCAAALVVESTGGDAGGLIGTVAEGGSISGCYAGGHTVEGAYSHSDYNVSAAYDAGGLVGSLVSGKIEKSYSTCSAIGDNAGGLVGSAESGSISNCYATGLVDGTSVEGAFAGSLSAGVSNCRYCYYYMVVNERDAEGGENGSKGYVYLGAVNSGDRDGITAFDADVSTYDGFVGAPSAWADAHPYDADTLTPLYRGSYPLKSAAGLGTTLDQDTKVFVADHYGDWPAPEVWVLNKKSGS